MADENPSIISHVSLGTNQYRKARQFYVDVLATLGCRVVMDFIVEHGCVRGDAWREGDDEPSRWSLNPQVGPPDGRL